jgi:glycosyltransferase involved in cell wall biosynthesis
MALPYLEEFGWRPLILTVDPDEQEGIKDPMLCRTVPEWTKTWQAGCLPLWLTRWIGLRNVGLRSFFHLARTGDRIIRQERPDAGFISTTMFPLMTLGRYWRWRHGLQYVLDFQDPWVAQAGRAGLLSRGLKYWVSQSLAWRLEPFALRRVSQIVSVSPAYVRALCDRYSWLAPSQFTVLPFGAAETDYAELRSRPVRQHAFETGNGTRNWVYVGRCVESMSLALRGLFLAMKRLFAAQPALRSQVRFHFIGTAYAPRENAVKTVEPLAAEAGLSDVVQEKTDRIPYFEALQCLLDADALIMPGSDDPGYTASKLCSYILARKPLLAVFHQESSVVEILHKTKAGTVVPFASGETPERVAHRILASNWLQAPPVPDTDWKHFEPYTAREMTRRLCEVIDRTAGP